MRIDHVLLAAVDVDRTAERLVAGYGLTSVAGGTHPHWGTANRIVPLGGQYLEIIGIADHAQAANNPLGRWLSEAVAHGDILVGLMVEPDDFEATCRRLSLTPMPGERARPDGSTASWRLAGMAEAIARTVPCFISWQDRDAVFAGDAGVGATGIAAVELGGDAGDISAWLGGTVDGLTLAGGPPGVRQLTIATAGGDVVLPERPFAG